ncbi:MAG: hypothetical protein ACLRUN_14635 [Christensenellales bacterium]
MRIVPYYPLLMQTKSDTLLYRRRTTHPVMTRDRACTSSCWPRAIPMPYDCGDFGFLPIANLSLAQTSQSIGVAQADDQDLPVIVQSDPEDESGNRRAV